MHCLHQIPAPKPYVCMLVFRVYPFHQVGAMKVTGCLSRYDIVFHDVKNSYQGISAFHVPDNQCNLHYEP